MTCQIPMRLMNWTVLLSITLSVAFSTARAQYPTQDDAAKEAYQEAKQLFENEKYQEAASRFRAAYELKPSWKILYNIGQSEAAAKNHGLALEAFEMFLSEGGDDIYTDRREQVIAEVDRLRRMVGYVQVKAPKGAVVYINNIERGTAPILMALPVSAGVRHVIHVNYRGEKLEEQEFRVVGAQKVTVEFTAPDENVARASATATTPGDDNGATETTPENQLAPDPASAGDTTLTSKDGADSAAAARSAKLKKMRLVGWILSGVGVGALVGGGVLGGMAIKKNNTLKEECGSSCPEKADEEKANIAMANVSTGLFIGGGAVAAAGVALLIIGTKKEKQLTKAMTIFPAVSKHTVGAGIEWRF
ncbi:MAG: tetratricopeptide repeat protein [Deltaproteobacteria bacterium]|nr:tetratricopeptide repeat protein [Deltaproteobacteria bacterium]